MWRKVLVIVLSCMVLFTMSSVPAFAAGKEVIQIGNKHYTYNEDSESFKIDNEWHKTIKDGLMTKYKSVSYYFDEKNTHETTYSYNNGKFSKAVEKFNGKKQGTTTYKYSGKNMKSITYKATGADKIKTEYKYTKKGDVKSWVNYVYKNGSWKKDSYGDNKYDSKGRLIRTNNHYQLGGKWIKNYDKYKYSKNKMTEKIYENNSLQSVITETYNSKGQVKKRVTSFKDGSGYKETVTFTYYDNGNIKTETNKDSYGVTIKETYRKDGQLKSRVQTDGEEETRNNYTYNDKGLMTKRVVKSTARFKQENGEFKKETHKTVFEFEYEGFFRSVYPKVVYIYNNGELYEKDVNEYKYFKDKTPGGTENLEDYPLSGYGRRQYV